MKTFTATLVTKQYQTVRVTLPDDHTHEDLILEIYDNASLSAGDFENDVYDIIQED
jgi:hypothetical protein